MNKDNILRLASEVITEEPIRFSIDIKPENKLHALLQKWKLKPTERIFTLRPLTAGSAIRISKLTVAVAEVEGLTAVDALTAISKDGDKICEALAIAVKNREKRPSKALIEFLKYNLTHAEQNYLFAWVIKSGFGFQDFMTTIFFIKKVDLITVKPTKKGPQVPGETSEDLLNISE